MILPILKLNDPLLTNRSEEVKIIDKDIKKLVKNMFETLYVADGIGLAAPQVGILKRIFVIDIERKNDKFVFINPVIKDISQKTIKSSEGCLSIPGISKEIARAESLVVEYLDIDGKQKRLEANNIFAVCIQHENDHLDGVLFIDRLSPEERLKVIKEYKKNLRL